MSNKNITASILYDYIHCPHRVWRDIYGPQEEKITEPNPFVQMLWEKGVQHEKEIVDGLGELEDISVGSLEERFETTLDAMKSGVELIYQGVLKDGGLLGIPDLLQKQKDGKYIAVDIKSGRGYEGVDETTGEGGKPKKHYAVQLCLYSQLLDKLGFLSSRKGYIIDIDAEKVEYNLEQKIGARTPETYWEFYESTKNVVTKLLDNSIQNSPALSGVCKLCPWYESCKKWVMGNDDLTRIFYVGRTKRDLINSDLGVKTVADMAEINISEILSKKDEDKEFLRGVGKKTIQKIVKRAIINVKDAKPVVYGKISFPEVGNELFFDIEDDPTQGFIYMHGVYVRNKLTGDEKMRSFVAQNVSDQEEKRAWKECWDFFNSFEDDNYAIYYYSQHEKTVYKKLAQLYPEVASVEEIEQFFAQKNVIDLYSRVILPKTDWPIPSYSLKEIALYLGFEWRDESPSGAMSIQWFNEFVESGDKSIMDRIVEYNEDDCKATMVIKDGVEELVK